DRVNEHAVKIPCSNTQQCIQLPASRMPLPPSFGFFQPPVFQLGNLVRQAAHAGHRPSSGPECQWTKWRKNRTAACNIVSKSGSVPGNLPILAVDSPPAGSDAQ